MARPSDPCVFAQPHTVWRLLFEFGRLASKLIEELADLGLIDELQDADTPQDGYDAIFRAE